VEPATLTDGTVVLRPLREDDIPAIVEACRDPVTIRWTTIPDPYDEQHARDFLADYSARGWAEDTRAVFAIADPRTDQYLGTIDLRLSSDESAEVGYNVAPWARGRGVGTAALRLAAGGGSRCSVCNASSGRPRSATTPPGGWPRRSASWSRDSAGGASSTAAAGSTGGSARSSPAS
jgi:hypothetical protein